MKRRQLPILITLIMVVASPLSAADWPKVTKVDRQPLAAQARRVAQALDYLGAPLPADDKKALETAAEDQDEARAVEAIQTVLDRYCLAGVRITTVGGSSPNQLVLETQRTSDRPALQQQTRPQSHLGGGSGPALRRPADVQQPTPGPRPVGPGAGIPHPSDLLSRCRPQGGEVGL